LPIRLVLADNHPLILFGIECLLRMEGDITILAKCANGEEALKAVHEHRPDILVLDIHLPGKDGLTVLKEIHDRGLPVNVVLFTKEIHEEQVIDCLRYGVKGIILKETSPQLLVECLRKVSDGSRWIDADSMGRAVETLLRREQSSHVVRRSLTCREIEIVKMVANGLRNKEIGEKLFICEGTVKLHIHNIYKKLNIRGRTALLRYAQDTGLA
jgi:DNA-binding NarL/FixJ family response regulator